MNGSEISDASAVSAWLEAGDVAQRKSLPRRVQRQWVADLRQAIDPDVVIEIAQRRQHVLAAPLRRQQARLVHHVAQAQDQRDSPVLQHHQRVLHLAAQA
jgi:hypothetical protein